MIKLSIMNIHSLTKNRGTGAGGANTNVNGKSFEQKCNMEPVLYELGYTKHVIDPKTKAGYYLQNTVNKHTISYVKQSGLKKFVSRFNECDVNELNHPDECFIIKSENTKPQLVILEMKHQNVEGSCFDKLYNALYYKCLYTKLIGEFYDVDYHFVVSEFIENKIQKKEKFKEIMDENNIKIFNARSYREDILEYLQSLIR